MRIHPPTLQYPCQHKYNIYLMSVWVQFVGFEEVTLQSCLLYRILISMRKPNTNPKVWYITWIDYMYKSCFPGAHVIEHGPVWLQACTTEWIAWPVNDHQLKASLVHVRSYRSRNVFMRAAIKQNHRHCLMPHPSRDVKRTSLAESRTISTWNADSASSDGPVISLQKSI